jgi:hypothetical protein
MKNILALIMTLAFLSGCMTQREYDSPPDQAQMIRYQQYGFFSNSDDVFIDIVGSLLSGDIGEVRDIDKSPTSIEGFDEGDFTSVELVMSSAQGSAMVGFSIHGGIGSPEMEPGYVHRFLPSAVQREKEDLYVEGIVCSGMMPGEWTYDDIVDMVEIEVEYLETPEGEPPAKRINFATTTEGDIATGHMDVVVVDQ